MKANCKLNTRKRPAWGIPAAVGGLCQLLLLAAAPALLSAAEESRPELGQFRPITNVESMLGARVELLDVNVSPLQLERMAQLQSYRVSLGGTYSDLMKVEDAERLVEMFDRSRVERAAYVEVTRIEWARMWEFKTNLTALVDFPGPMPTQLRVHVERILTSLTNSPAVSYALRNSRKRVLDGAVGWQIGNLNAAYPEDMEVLIQQVRDFPGDAQVYLDGLVSLLESARGYSGPAARKRSLTVYLNLSLETKGQLREVLTRLAGHPTAAGSIRAAADRARTSLDSIWEVVVSGEAYDLSTIEGVENFLEEGNARTHFMDHLIVLGTIMVHGGGHPEVESVSGWLLTNPPPRLRAFVESPLLRGEGIIAREARQINYAIAKAKFVASHGMPVFPGDTNGLLPSDLSLPVEADAQTGLTRVHRWVTGHMEVVAGGILLLFAALIVPQILSEVKFGKRKIKKRTLYAVADEVMGTVKEEASGRLAGMSGEIEHLLGEIRAAQAGFIAGREDGEVLEYLMGRAGKLIHDKSITNGRPTVDAISKSVDGQRPDAAGLVRTLTELFPVDFPSKGTDPNVVEAAWCNRMLEQRGFAAAGELNRRLLVLIEDSARLKSVVEIGKDPDKCPTPQEVVTAMKGMGVDVGQIIDNASKRAVTSWEARYQLNRHADLVIAAYYKKHFNRFIDLVKDS